MQEKLETLRAWCKQAGKMAIAFSAGVDSTFLLAVAHEALGGDGVCAITALSPAYPAREAQEAAAFCAGRGIAHYTFETHELQLEGFDRNPVDRCYICKKELFAEIRQIADQHGFAHVCDGSNMDDLRDYRPGTRALEELHIESPLRDCGFTKADIRALSREMGLPTWDKQSAACLYSRFAYGDTLSRERLAQVEAAEAFLQERGYTTVRVRMGSDDSARIELAPQDIARAAADSERCAIVERLKLLGFSFVSLDLQGYRTGAMNELL